MLKRQQRRSDNLIQLPRSSHAHTNHNCQPVRYAVENVEMSYVRSSWVSRNGSTSFYQVTWKIGTQQITLQRGIEPQRCFTHAHCILLLGTTKPDVIRHSLLLSVTIRFVQVTIRSVQVTERVFLRHRSLSRTHCTSTRPTTIYR